MALTGPSLPETNTIPKPKKVVGGRIMAKTFAAGSGTIAALTPLARLTATPDHYVVWDPAGSGGAGAGAETIVAFSDYREPHTLDAGGETIANVLLAGTMRAADVVVPSSTDRATLDTALKSTELRKLGFLFDDLPGSG